MVDDCLERYMSQVGYVTIGQVARAASVAPSTVRFYVSQDLLRAAGRSPGGFMLFDLAASLARIQQIQDLQQQERLTLAEIRARLMLEGQE